MDVKQMRLLDFFESPAIKLEIPPYQRVYSWTPRQCYELWLDIMRAARDNREHFSGIVIMTRESDCAEGTERLSVVDGQQRLTTMTLLLTAIARHIDAMGLADENLPSPTLIRNGLLHGDDGESPFRKLTLSRDDDATIAAVVAGTALPDSPSKHIVQNLAFFSEQMSQDNFDPIALWQGLGRLTVIACYEDNSDIAQEVFESANSKGLPLTLADMVRNYLLLEESPEEQERLYDEYWAEAAGVFDPDPGSRKLNSAITAWICIRFRTARVGNSEYVYSSFKRYIADEFEGERESVLLELRAFCHVWREQWRYHAIKKYLSRPWAVNGAATLTQRFRRQKATNPEYAEALWRKLEKVDDKW
uniref:GmrSD restriction endonucleases N-terminal domain-containing protein n=1 Tax=uncultured bacterium Contig1772 TaxID=1393512 RepID=W0FNV4_9BACT|nr:hypothetical protein [uncultured bacterium Contig1772]